MITQHQHHSCRFRFPPGPALCVLALASVLIALPASAASYAGRAVGAYVNVPTAGVGPLYLSDTGALASTGGWEGAGSPSENVPAVLTASVLNASTSGANGNGSGSASLADLVVFAGQPAQLTASFVYAQAGSGASGGSASTQVYDLTLGGLPVTVTGLPNQVVSLPGVATIMSTPARKACSCGDIPTPPYTAAAVIGVCTAISFSASRIWAASSRVGVTTRARVFPRGRSMSLCRIGRRNANVFPLPVIAQARTSRPSSAGGIASA